VENGFQQMITIPVELFHKEI